MSTCLIEHMPVQQLLRLMIDLPPSDRVVQSLTTLHRTGF